MKSRKRWKIGNKEPEKHKQLKTRKKRDFENENEEKERILGT